MHFAETLGWTANLLPVVSNPNREISPDSKIKGLGKTPSQVNFRGQAAGLAKWTKTRATPRDIERWSEQPDHGICVQTGNDQGGRAPIVIAFDIDVPDSAKSAVIRDALLTALPFHSFPERYREGTGKTLLAFEVEPGEELFKRIVPVDGGVVEMLALGQQFIAEGTYIDSRSKGADGRYLWRRGGSVPRLARAEFAVLWDTLELFAAGEIRMARARRAPIDGAEMNVGDDPVAAWIAENWNVYDHDSDGRLFIECPFAAEHTSDSGPTATAYFPAGTGGYQRGHFDCKHAHCTDRKDPAFREAIGYEADQFPDLDDQGRGIADSRSEQGFGVEEGSPRAEHPGVDAGRDRGTALGPPQDDWPRLIRDKNGRIEGSATNVTRTLACASMTGMRLAWDDFAAGAVWAPEAQWPPQWRSFPEEMYTEIRIAMELRGFKEFSEQRLRACTHHTAIRNRMDTAKEWLSRIEWDGVERVETFIANTLPGVGDTPYSRAMSRYMWTAMAGRVLQPGVKADMVPVLVGAEGLRKSSWVAALCSNPEAFTDTVSLKHRDNDNSRKMRGRLVIELAEMKGLASRDGEEIRAFLAQQYEEWTPKYMEMAIRFARRFLMIGTTNDRLFLEDRMGMRRLLPVEVLGPADVDRVIAERDQLWAEGAVLFGCSGVDWSVETHAQPERNKFLAHDDWTAPVARWLLSVDPVTHRSIYTTRFGTAEALVSAIGISAGQHDRTKQIRMGRVLSGLGCQMGKSKGGPRWYECSGTAAKGLEAWAASEEGNAL